MFAITDNVKAVELAIEAGLFVMWRASGGGFIRASSGLGGEFAVWIGEGEPDRDKLCAYGSSYIWISKEDLKQRFPTIEDTRS
jgi:hypothetical protein